MAELPYEVEVVRPRSTCPYEHETCLATPTTSEQPAVDECNCWCHRHECEESEGMIVTERCYCCGAEPPCPSWRHRDPAEPSRDPCPRCGGTGMVGHAWPAGSGKRTCPACRGCGVEQ